MKNLNSFKKLSKIETWYVAFVSFLALLSSNVVAQTTVPEKVDVNINAGSDGGSVWYAQPWMWVVGVAVFIIIIVAITRSGTAKRDV